MWPIDSEKDVCPLVNMKGRMEGLDELDNTIMALNFDSIVERNVIDGRPSSTDAILYQGEWTMFVELKGRRDPPEDGDGDVDPKSKTARLKYKASETVHIYDEFLAGNWEMDPPKRRLIVVTDDGFSSIRANVGDMAGEERFCPEFLKRYASSDLMHNRIFYDQVWWMSSEEFVRFINDSAGDKEIRESPKQDNHEQGEETRRHG